MNALHEEFAAGLVETALRDIEAALDRALKKASTHAARMALVKLREKAMTELEHLAKRAPEPEPEGEELTAALVAIAKEFRKLAEKARPAFKRLGAEDRFDQWEREYHGRLSEALRNRDLQTARIVVDRAIDTLAALLDQVLVDQAIGEAAESKALIPNFKPMRRAR